MTVDELKRQIDAGLFPFPLKTSRFEARMRYWTAMFYSGRQVGVNLALWREYSVFAGSPEGQRVLRGDGMDRDMVSDIIEEMKRIYAIPDQFLGAGI